MLRGGGCRPPPLLPSVVAISQVGAGSVVSEKYKASPIQYFKRKDWSFGHLYDEKVPKVHKIGSVSTYSPKSPGAAVTYND